MRYLKSETRKVFKMTRGLMKKINQLNQTGNEKLRNQSETRLKKSFDDYLNAMPPVKKVFLITMVDNTGNEKHRIIKAENPRMELRNYKAGEKRLLDVCKNGLISGDYMTVTFEMCFYN